LNDVRRGRDRTLRESGSYRQSLQRVLELTEIAEL
jgi:hypothetical protein